MGNSIKLEVGKKYMVEDKFKMPDGEIVIEKYVTTISWIKQKEGFLYVGHTPVDFRNGRFGAFRVYEGVQKPFGKTILCEA